MDTLYEPFSQDGTIPFQIPSTSANAFTYYRVFGDLQSSLPPVIVLHGGTGAGHEYCRPFCKLQLQFNFPVIIYDQIGCGKSTHFRDRAGDHAFWHLDLFVAELKNLIQHFDLDREDSPGYHVLGHSWGSILGHYFASQQPRGLRRLVLASGTCSGEDFVKGLWERTRTPSPDVALAIEDVVQQKDFSGTAYQNAAGEFMETFLRRAKPDPPEQTKSNANFKDDMTVREALVGQCPWIYDGVWRQWDSVPYSHQVTATTLMLTGEYDTSPDRVSAPIFETLSRVRWITLSKASHMYHLDLPEMQSKTLSIIIGEFLLQDRTPLKE